MKEKFPIHYETIGDRNKPSIILTMGIGGQLIHWPENFIEGLSEHFYVVIYDNRDAGLSKHYDHLKTPEIKEAIALKMAGKPVQLPYLLDDMARDIIVLLDKLNIEKTHILGISMGGIIAQLTAIYYLERVLSLICIATTSGDINLPSAKPEVAEFFSSPKRNSETSDDYVNDKLALYKIYNHPDYFDEQKIRELHIKGYHRDHSAAGFKRQLLAMLAASPRVEELKKLNVSSLIIHGEYDPVFSIEHGKNLAGLIPNSELVILEKLGHGLPEQLSDEVCQSINNFIFPTDEHEFKKPTPW